MLGEYNRHQLAERVPTTRAAVGKLGADLQAVNRVIEIFRREERTLFLVVRGEAIQLPHEVC